MTPSSPARLAAILGFLIVLSLSPVVAWEPIRTHPQNPCILEFRGQPTLLRTFGPHYGWLFDTSLDYMPHMDTLQRDGMNLMRIWCMGYPADVPENFIQPWPRSTSGGNALDNLKKWDFNAWDEAYFTRLKDIAQVASDRGIVVEFTFFSTYYGDAEWLIGSFHPSNNVQGFGPNNWNDSLRIVNPGLVAAQKAAVRRIVRELNGFDNVYYEVMNEPFWNQPNLNDSQDVAFHNAILAEIRAEEATLPNRHLVAHNFPQQSAAMSSDFDIINEHYPAEVPTTTIAGAEALLENQYSSGKVLSLDETDTDTALQLRLESWMFLIGGGAIYNGLDANYDVYTSENLSGDNALGNAMRLAVRNIGTYMDSLHLPPLRRNLGWVTGGIPSGATLQASATPGQQYVAYLHHGKKAQTNFQLAYNPIDSTNQNASLVVNLPAGSWRAIWTRPSDRGDIKIEEFTHTGGSKTLPLVTYQADVALRIDRTGSGDLTPPPRPAALFTVPDPVDGSILLSWDSALAYDIASYRIYRSETPGASIETSQLVGTLTADDTEFLDQETQEYTTYHYVVSAVDLSGNESTASGEASATAILTYPDIEFSVNGEGLWVLQWTAALPGWYLQHSAELSTDTWSYSPLVPVLVGDQYQVTFVPNPEYRFFRLIHQPPPPPRIEILQQSGGSIVLGWTTSSVGWYLQESPDLNPESWSISPITPTVVGDQYQITITSGPASPRRFFRMMLP